MSTNFVSRAHDKLEFALDNFDISVENSVCIDFGCSTGGFVECMLNRGAKKVYAIDTAYGELAWKLRNNERVVVMERTNALYAEIPELVDFISIDVGWTRQKLIIPIALKFIKSDGDIVSLIKPHYECDKSKLINGKVKDDEVQGVIDETLKDISEFKIKTKGIIESPVAGKKGKNKEFLLWAQPN